jgi:gluconokinase
MREYSATMAHVPDLRSPYIKVGRLVYFGRMLDKIRLHAAGRLPVADYAPNLGKGFDGRCCKFLRVNYDELKARTLAGGTDEEILTWAHERGGARTDEECEIWNGFMTKRGWRDVGAEILAKRVKESALEAAPIMTMFDYLDFDEGRDPVSTQAWLK